MADRTHIEWTDATVNAINGCSVCSPGCANCYAMRLAGTRMKSHPTRTGLTIDSKAGPVWNGEVRLHEPALLQPLRWQRPRRIFWNAHGDMFHPNVPDEWIDQCFATMILTPHHIHQVLTKRSDRMREYFSRSHWHIWSKIGRAIDARRWENLPAIMGSDRTPIPNAWLGVSVEDKARADERIPDLLATPAAVRWLSCEPLLGPIWLWQHLIPQYPAPGEPHNYRVEGNMHIPVPTLPGLDWIVAGGESGPGARPMHPDWVRSLRDQCADRDVPFFFKQWGDFLPEGQFDATRFQWAPGNDGKTHWWRPEPPIGTQLEDAHCSIRIGKKKAGRMLDGVIHDGAPA